MSTTKTVAGITGAVAIIAAVSACGTAGSVKPVPVVTKTVTAPAQQITVPPADHTPPAAPPSTPAPSDTSESSFLNMAMGSPVAVTDPSGGQNGTAATYHIKIDQVVQNAPVAAYQDVPPGFHLAAAQISLKGVTGVLSDDVNSDASVTDTATNTYSAAMDDTTLGGNFQYGQVTLAPGMTATGWVTFEVPNGQKVATVVWTPSGGMGEVSPASWATGA